MTRVFNETKHTEVAADAHWATGPWERMRGLLGRRSLPEGGGMIFRTGSVHTWFMRFVIDVVFLDRDGVVLKAVQPLPAFRFTAARRAQTCLELPTGTIALTETEPGDRITFQEPPRLGHTPRGRSSR